MVLSPLAYDDMADRSEQDLAAGRVVDAEESLARIRTKYGLGQSTKTDR